MRRVLVPLDGSELAASILPDAQMLAGVDGQLILVHDINYQRYDPEVGLRTEEKALEWTWGYLEDQAENLRQEGTQVRVHALMAVDAAVAIDESARIFKADFIACATHGRGPAGRLIRGGDAWRAVAQSPVPILLYHPRTLHKPRIHMARPRSIMVPLDGSDYAEQALPLALELAQEWAAQVQLVQVVPVTPVPADSRVPYEDIPPDYQTDAKEAQAYLDAIAERLPQPVSRSVLFGPPSKRLIEFSSDERITHVVMSTHGRTGLARAILGSVADDLVQHLHCPIILLPTLAAQQQRPSASEELRTELRAAPRRHPVML